MQIKIIEKIKKLIKEKIRGNKKNNNIQNFVEYKRNKYGFFSPKNSKK